MRWPTVVGIAERKRPAMESDVYLPCTPSRRARGPLGTLLLALLPLLFTPWAPQPASAAVTPAAPPSVTVRAEARTSDHPEPDAAHPTPAPTTSTGRPGASPMTRTPEDTDNAGGPASRLGSGDGRGSRSLPDTGPPSVTLVAGIVAALLIIAGGLAARALRRRD